MNLSACQVIAEQHNLYPYQLTALQQLCSVTSVEGKNVLEIGGSNLPRDLVIGQIKAGSWTCVDYIPPSHYALTLNSRHYNQEVINDLDAANIDFSTPYSIYNGMAEDLPAAFEGQFDIVVSITALEHIGKLPQALKKMHMALKPGCLFFSYHGPLWSSSVGHHCWVTPDLNFNNTGKLPPHGHLRLSPTQMLAHLYKHYPEDVAEEAVFQIYNSERINRFFYEDYVNFLKLSPFTRINIQPYGETHIDSEILKQLRTKYHDYTNFSAYGMIITAHKGI